jgi:hypothetical protein
MNLGWRIVLKSIFVLAAFSAGPELCFGKESNATSVLVISETLGQVGDHVVTSREVRIAKLIEDVLYPSAKANDKANTLMNLATPVTEPQFQIALTAVLLEIVVSFEAQNFNLVEIPDEELQASVVQVENSAAAKAVERRWGLQTSELKSFVKRKMIARRFLKFKTNSMSGIVSDSEVKAYYDKNRSKFSGESYAAYKENIRSFLQQQQLEDRLRAWFEVIQRKYKVRNFLSDKPL